MSGWTQVDYNVTGWNAWSAWQNSSISETTNGKGQKNREVQTQTIPAQYRTIYPYYRYKYWNSSQAKWYYTYSSSQGGEYQAIDLTYSLSPKAVYGGGWQAYGSYIYNGDSGAKDLWWGKDLWQQMTQAAYTQWRSRSAITTYTFEKWGDWSEWTEGTAPVASSSKEVETRTTYRFRSNDIKLTAYNYKRYRYTNLSTNKEIYTYNTTYADSQGYPGEWEYDKTFEEKKTVATVDDGITLYGGYNEESWYAADVNEVGNVTEYITYDTLEDTNGIERKIAGSINAPGKLATLLIFRQTNQDPTASQLEYVDQTVLGENGEYDFAFRTKDEPSSNTGDFIIMLAIEGGTNPIYIDRIKAPRPIYTVVFADEDGTELSRQSVVEGSAAVLPEEIPQKEGHEFIGWDESISNVNKDITVVATYAKKKFNVVFVDWDNNDVAIKEYEYGDPLVLDEMPEKEGSSFTGWVTEKGTDVITITDNMVVTAKYDLNSYKVVFLDWEGNVISEQAVEYGGQADIPDVGDPESGELIFKEWNNEYGAYYVTDDVILSPMSMFKETVEAPLFSIESGSYSSPQTISITCDVPDAKIYFTTDGTLPNYEPTAEGTYTKGSLYYSPIVVSKDTLILATAFVDGKNASEVVAAEYTFDEAPVTYTVKFDTDGGSEAPPEQIVNVGEQITKPDEPEKPGFSFDGWYNGNTKIDFSTYTVTNDITLKVKWVKKDNPLTMVNIKEIGGVTVPIAGAAPATKIEETAQYTGTIKWVPNDIQFEDNTQYTATINLTPKEGYTLTGVSANYFVVPEATTVINSASSDTIIAIFPATGDITINPSVTKVVVAPAITNVRKGTTQRFSATISGIGNPAQTVTWSVEGKNSVNTSISKDGLLTIGKDETAKALTVKAVSIADTSKYGAAKVTVIAEKFTVTFQSKGGSKVAAVSGIEEGKKVSKPKSPTRKGYVFSGWYKDSKLKSAWDFSKNEISKNTTLYAKWTKINAKITPTTSRVKKEKTLKLTAGGNAPIKSVKWKTSSKAIIKITAGAKKKVVTLKGMKKGKKSTITATIIFKDGTKKTVKRTISVR